MEEQLKALQTAFEEKIKQAASKDELDKIKSDMKADADKLKAELKEEQKAEFDEQLKAQKTDLEEKLKAQWEAVEKKIKEKEKMEKLSFGDKLKAAFAAQNLISEDENGQELFKMDINSDQKIRVKAAFDMNTAGTTASVATGLQTNYGMMRQELLMSGDVEMQDVFQHMTLAQIERYMAKVVEYEETDGSAIKLETAAAGDSSFKLKTEDYKVFDYGVKFRVHRNMLRTWAGLQARIQSIGMDRLKSKISTFVIDASAAGDGTTTPYGLLSTGKYTAYDTTLRSGEVKAANIVDVIKIAVLQSDIAKKPINAVMLNHVDIAEIESLKDANDNSVRLSGLVVDATGKLAYIYGLRVIKTSKVTANTAIFINSNESLEFGDKFNLETLIGYDKTEDFSKGIVTIQLETELAFGLGDPLSIIYVSDIATAAATLNAPAS